MHTTMDTTNNDRAFNDDLKNQTDRKDAAESKEERRMNARDMDEANEPDERDPSGAEKQNGAAERDAKLGNSEAQENYREEQQNDAASGKDDISGEAPEDWPSRQRDDDQRDRGY